MVWGFSSHCPHWAAGALGDRHCVLELGTLKDLSSVTPCDPAPGSLRTYPASLSSQASQD